MNDESREHDRRTRREFLLSGSAAAVGCALGASSVFPGGLAIGATQADPYGGFRMGVQSYSFRNFTFPDALVNTQKLGLKYIEIFPGHLSHSGPMKKNLTEEKKRMSDAGITPDSYGVVPFSKDEKAAREIFDFAKALELRAISADPENDSFDMLDKLVAEYKIPIAIHNHGPHHKWGKPEAILAAVKDHHQMIGVCCDCGHFLRADVDPVDAIKILKGRVYGFHIKDFVTEQKEVEAGDGKLKIAPLLKEARAQKFSGACSLEYELNAKDPMAGMEKGLENFRKAVQELGS